MISLIKDRVGWRILSKVLFISCLLTLSFLVGCSGSLLPIQRQNGPLPTVLDIIWIKGTFFNPTREPMGAPLLPPISLRAQILPFTNASFKTYYKKALQNGDTNLIMFNDTMKVKPRFLRLSILNKIELTNHLNSNKYDDIRTYISQDKPYKIITQIDLTLKEEELSRFARVESVHVRHKENGIVELELNSEGTVKTLVMNNLEVFDYKWSNFCWGMDKFGKKTIMALSTGNQPCPNATEIKPYKLENKRDKF